MMFFNLKSKFIGFTSWMFDRFVANPGQALNDYLFDHWGLADILSDERQRCLLDAGCGGGQWAVRLKERYPHLDVWGIDISPDQIARAEQRAQQMKCTAHFKVADVQALPFPDATFDVVYSKGSIKHWPDLQQGIAECWRVLKPGGEILLSDGTCDATLEQMYAYYDLLHFPKWIKKPLAALIYRRLIRPAPSMETIRRIVSRLKMPEEAVYQDSAYPLFLIRAQKPRVTF